MSARLLRHSGKRRVIRNIEGSATAEAHYDGEHPIIVVVQPSLSCDRDLWRMRMDENPWNAQARIIEIAGEFELAIYDDRGRKIAIATGRTEDDCRANTAAIIEGLKLRSDKLKG